MKHNHYDCIVAWAAGEKVEFRSNENGKWREVACPSWDEHAEYRVKKEPVVTVKYFQENRYNLTNTIRYEEFTPDLEKWDLKITYHDDVAVKVELPNGDRNE